MSDRYYYPLSSVLDNQKQAQLRPFILLFIKQQEIIVLPYKEAIKKDFGAIRRVNAKVFVRERHDRREWAVASKGIKDTDYFDINMV